MRIVGSLLNRSEEVAFREIQSIAADNNLKVFSKIRLSDVIKKDRTILSQRDFDFYTRSHFDFVVTDEQFRPVMVVEYDGPFHADAKQQERDGIKNELCRRAGLGLLRIHDRHVTKLYRGMSVLRWIVEVSELEKAFYKSQAEGQIPSDELFDPVMSIAGSTKRFPYWLSAPAIQSIHHFLGTLDPLKPKGWISILGNDDKNVAYRLSFLYFSDKILFAKNSVRRQDLDFPQYDLLDEINTCELGINLKLFNQGRISCMSKDDFKAEFYSFCERYNAHPSHSMGSFPFEFSWPKL